MILNVLGCSGSIAAGSHTTSFLLDGDVLIDAGTGVGSLALDALARIDTSSSPIRTSTTCSPSACSPTA